MSLSHRKKVAVIGDVMLDEFIEGVVTRKSPEANAPIVLMQNEKGVLGGAANVASNIKSLGGEPVMFSLVGNDPAASKIRFLFKKAKISNVLLEDRGRITPVKSRIFNKDKYLLRFDREKKEPISRRLSDEMLLELTKRIHTFDVIVLSDYNKGVFSKYLVSSIISLAKKNHLPVIADIKPQNISWFKGVALVKPNKSEAIKITGTSNLRAGAEKIANKLDCDVLITRGSQGMLVYTKSAKQFKVVGGLKTKLRDIVGAGDVVMAVLSLFMTSGRSLPEIAKIANVAASLSVEKHGTATVSLKELVHKYDFRKKIQ